MSAGKCKCIGAPASNNAIIALRNSICRFSDAAGLPQGEGIVVAVRQEVSGVVVSVLTARHVVFDQQNKLVGWFADFSSIPGACLYVSDVLEESSAKIEIVPGLDPCSVDWALVALEAVPDKPLDDAEQSKLLALPVWSLANVKGELYQCCKAGCELKIVLFGSGDVDVRLSEMDKVAGYRFKAARELRSGNSGAVVVNRAGRTVGLYRGDAGIWIYGRTGDDGSDVVAADVAFVRKYQQPTVMHGRSASHGSGGVAAPAFAVGNRSSDSSLSDSVQSLSSSRDASRDVFSPDNSPATEVRTTRQTQASELFTSIKMLTVGGELDGVVSPTALPERTFGAQIVFTEGTLDNTNIDALRAVFVSAFSCQYQSFSSEELGTSPKTKADFLVDAFNSCVSAGPSRRWIELRYKPDTHATETTVGFLTYEVSPDSSIIYLSQLAVHPDKWSTGVGRRLVWEMILRLMPDRLLTINGNTRHNHNRRALAFYEQVFRARRTDVPHRGASSSAYVGLSAQLWLVRDQSHYRTQTVGDLAESFLEQIALVKKQHSNRNKVVLLLSLPVSYANTSVKVYGFIDDEPRLVQIRVESQRFMVDLHNLWVWGIPVVSVEKIGDIVTLFVAVSATSKVNDVTTLEEFCNVMPNEQMHLSASAASMAPTPTSSLSSSTTLHASGEQSHLATPTSPPPTSPLSASGAHLSASAASLTMPSSPPSLSSSSSTTLRGSSGQSHLATSPPPSSPLSAISRASGEQSHFATPTPSSSLSAIIRASSAQSYLATSPPSSSSPSLSTMIRANIAHLGTSPPSSSAIIRASSAHLAAAAAASSMMPASPPPSSSSTSSAHLATPTSPLTVTLLEALPGTSAFTSVDRGMYDSKIEEQYGLGEDARKTFCESMVAPYVKVLSMEERFDFAIVGCWLSEGLAVASNWGVEMRKIDPNTTDPKVSRSFNLDKPVLRVYKPRGRHLLFVLSVSPGTDYLRVYAQSFHYYFSVHPHHVRMGVFAAADLYTFGTSEKVEEFIKVTRLDELRSFVDGVHVVLGDVQAAAQSFAKEIDAGTWSTSGELLRGAVVPNDNPIWGYELRKSKNAALLFLGSKNTYFGNLAYTLALALFQLGAQSILHVACIDSCDDSVGGGELVAPVSFVLGAYGGGSYRCDSIVNALRFACKKRDVHLSIPTPLDLTLDLLRNWREKHLFHTIDNESAYLVRAAVAREREFGALYVVADRSVDKSSSTFANADKGKLRGAVGGVLKQHFERKAEIKRAAVAVLDHVAPLRVLLVGRDGAGKSSIFNRVVAILGLALSGSWPTAGYTAVGAVSGSVKTDHLDVHRFGSGFIADMPGIVENSGMHQLLDSAIGGRLPPNEVCVTHDGKAITNDNAAPNNSLRPSVLLYVINTNRLLSVNEVSAEKALLSYCIARAEEQSLCVNVVFTNVDTVFASDAENTNGIFQQLPFNALLSEKVHLHDMLQHAAETATVVGWTFSKCNPNGRPLLDDDANLMTMDCLLSLK